MKIPFLIALTLSVLLAGCGEKANSNSGQETNTTSGSSPLTAPVDYLGAVAKAQQTAVKTIDTTSINHAIQLFQADKGRYPKDLNELVTGNYLGKIPAPPYGYKIDYDAATGEVKVVKQ